MANPTITFQFNTGKEGQPTWSRFGVLGPLGEFIRFRPQYLFKVGFPVYDGPNKVFSWLANKLLWIKTIPIRLLYRNEEVKFVADTFWIDKPTEPILKWWQIPKRE